MERNGERERKRKGDESRREEKRDRVVTKGKTPHLLLDL